MAGDASAGDVDVDVDVEDAPPNTWDHLAWWMKASGQRQRAHPIWSPLAKPPGKCLAERTTDRACKRPTTRGRQPSLLAHLRPARWADAPMELNLDILELIADALMRNGDARTLRALAVVDRECAAAVRNTLRVACDALRERAEAFAEAQDKRRLLGYDHEEAMSEAQLERVDAAEIRRMDALDAYEDCMLDTGIRHPRVETLTRKPWSRWFHGATSLLGHLQMGCELCSREDNVRDTGHRAGPVSLFACRTCAHKHRVRFFLAKEWTDRTFHHPKGRAQRLTARFPPDESEANSYACALMSKRESHRRRMAGSHIPKARRTVPLSRRVYTNQPWSFELEDCWQLWSDEKNDGPMLDEDEMQFELWHELPPSIPNYLTFARVMKLGSDGESARTEATNHSAARRRVRALTDARRAAFNSIANTHRDLIRRVNNVVRARGFRAWVQVLDLCCAARAFELRWLFRAEESRFGDWRKARYQLLDMDPAALVEAAKRVDSAACVMERVLASIVYFDGTKPKYFLGRADATRACIIEILKHLPTACLSLASQTMEDNLYEKVQHLRKAVMLLSLVVDPALPAHNNQRLRIDVKIDRRILGRANLELNAIVTKYTISKLSSLVDLPEDVEELSPKTIARVQDLANGWGYTERQDRMRAELYGLPGAWPCVLTWMRND